MMNSSEVINQSTTVNDIVRGYSPLHYSPKLRSMLNTIYPGRNFDSYPKLQLHKALNEFICQRYSGEEILKYSLFQEFVGKDLVAAFEMPVGSSRLDFLTINGKTTSFEIKSELDNLSKLRKQVADYLSVFEYNNLLIDERHLKKSLELVPECVGIICHGSKQFVYRKATLSNQLDSSAQLSLLTKRELRRFFSCTSVNEILDSNDSNAINVLFKSVLKQRYNDRWQFVVARATSILPIDVQFFFNRNIEPSVIYR
jgi:hypothetical protein